MDSSSTQQEASPDHLTQPPVAADTVAAEQEALPPRQEPAQANPIDERPRFEIDIYQIVDDGMMKKNRADGTGFDWKWAEYKRDWMDATPGKYAYRCLPLTIMNQTGWWVTNPVGFTAMWDGNAERRNIDFWFDHDPQFWNKWVNNQFGLGIITWNTPFLFRTRPVGSRLLVMGPPNHFKRNCHALTALVESDWISMSFTMNYRLFTPNMKVRFDVGEPLFQVIPIATNICADLEDAHVVYKLLQDDPEVHQSYLNWDASRKRFLERSRAAGGQRSNEWQKDYFHGRDADGRFVASTHMTRVVPPKVDYQLKAP